MATATEKWSERTGSVAANNADVGVRVFHIINAATEADCYTADLTLTDLSNPTGKVPILNEADPRNSRRKVNSLAVSMDGLNLWRLTVGYAIPVNGGTFDGTEDNPLLQPVRWSWQRSKVTEDVDRDKDGNPLVNSNRVAYANGTPRDFTRRILEARRFESAYPAALAEAYEDTVNSTNFSGPAGVSFATATTKCNIITVLGEYTDDSPYVEVLYQFEIRADGWKARKLDEGTMGRAAGGVFVPLYSATGDKITSPVLLNGGGNPTDFGSYKLGNPSGTIAGASDPAAPTGATIETIGGSTFLLWNIYPTADLNSLGL